MKRYDSKTPLPSPLPASRGEGTGSGSFSLSRLRERVGVRAPLPALAFACAVVSVAHAAPAPDTAAATAPLPDLAALNKAAAKLAPVDLVVDVAALPASERAALGEMIAAAKIMDALFLRQVWAGNEAVLLDLVRDRSPLGQARLHAFLQNKGPWLRLEGDPPFLPGVGPKPPQANLYPIGATKAEI